MKIKETREQDLKKWLNENQVEKVGDLTKDNQGEVKEISFGENHGRYLVKVKPVKASINLGAGAGSLLIIHFNNDISRVLENLNKIVTTHFKIETLKEKYLGKKVSSQRSMFYLLFFELYIKDVTEKRISLTEQIREYTGLDRTSFNHCEKTYKQELYLYDTRIINGDYFYNHFYLLLEKLTGDDYSHKLKSKPFVPEPYKSRFLTVIEDHYQEVEDLIRKGVGLNDISNKLFPFYDGKTLYRRIVKYSPGLFESFKKSKEKRRNIRFNFSKIIDENITEIKDMIKEGLPLSEVNNKFFYYKDDNTLYRKIRLEKKELHSVFYESREIRRRVKREKSNNGIYAEW